MRAFMRNWWSFVIFVILPAIVLIFAYVYDESKRVDDQEKIEICQDSNGQAVMIITNNGDFIFENCILPSREGFTIE